MELTGRSSSESYAHTKTTAAEGAIEYTHWYVQDRALTMPSGSSGGVVTAHL